MSPSLAALYAGALDKAARANDPPTVGDDTHDLHDLQQELVRDTLSDLEQLSSRVASLSLFSPNEVLDDVSTPDLVYLSLPFIHAEVRNRLRTTDRDDRMSNLERVQRHLHAYTSSIETYNLVPKTERVLYSQQPSSIRDAATRREVKIKQYKAEKDLRTRIEVIRRRRRQSAPPDRSLSDFDLVASLLPLEHEARDLEDENVHREATLLLLELFYAQACAQLQGVDQEAQLLRSAPVPPPSSKPPADERRSKTKDQEADMWKINTAPALSSRGPLLDPRGKPLQPFTILPASTSDRARLQAQVFGPAHRLPTMSIDEYLEIERQRGGILPAGGSQPQVTPPSSEQLTVDSEADGTALGESKADEKRLKDEQWAQYKEAHPRGAGNTMNRG